MKIGDLVTTKSRYFLGVIIDSDVWRYGHKRHQVYWSSPKPEKNPAWVREEDLELA